MLIRMPSIDEPEDPTAREREILRGRAVRYRVFGLACTGLACVAATLAGCFAPDTRPLALLLFALTTAYIWLRDPHLWLTGYSAIEDSRVRVREAERDLENAVRIQAGGDMHAVRLGDEAPPQGSQDHFPYGQHHYGGPRVGPAADSHRLTLAEQWKLTHARLDLYHHIALEQARKSFHNAQISMGLGFALLVGFVIVALKASTTAGSIVAGGLGAVSAGLAGYAGKAFVRSQEAAATHLRSYVDQPLEFSKCLAAERLVADAGLTTEQRREVLMAIAQAMVAPPDAPASAGGEQQAAQVPPSRNGAASA
ncbi:hypothetical protein ACFW3D_28095 [Streptomyces sp. NPDC058864]